ncbi:hypothetical protein [Oceanobacillus indicireducens]|uniref:Uncharacterized protein n=1 Tax=Oceanobacillus indicireducens TaxID=1004261 RepID=A0A917Y0E9_9BACI|nr:hypothetical protein [Oceanobacillus indicireducens]GGN59412.1 hypothetical protein GCM10007971_22500 [Oceanobacillus indicireducens]
MNMPTPCPECGEICEFDRMKNIGHELYCDECYEELEGESE